MPEMNRVAGPPQAPTPPLPPSPLKPKTKMDDNKWIVSLLRKIFGFDDEEKELDPYTIRPGIGPDTKRVADNIEDPNFRMPTPTPTPRPY